MKKFITWLFSLIIIGFLGGCATTGLKKKKKERPTRSYYQPYKKKVKLVRSKKIDSKQSSFQGVGGSGGYANESERILLRLNNIQEHYNNNAYMDVVIEYEALAGEVSENIIPDYFTLLYGVSLIQKRDFDRGFSFLSKLKFDELEMPDRLAILVRLCNYYQRKDDKEVATKYYKKSYLLAKDLNSILEIAKQKLFKIDKDKKGESKSFQRKFDRASSMAIEGRNLWKARKIAVELMEAVSGNARMSAWLKRVKGLLANIENRIENWFEREMIAIQTLYLEQENFSKATELLNKMKMEFVDEQYQQKIREVYDDLVKAKQYSDQATGESKIEGSKSKVMSERIAKIYDEVKKHVREKNYKMAIEKLESIEGSELHDKVVRMKKTVINKYVKVQRMQAAEYFFKGGNVKDRDRKIELYLRAYQILEAVTIEFPDASVISKVNENLSTIATELAKLNYFISSEKPSSSR